MISVERDNEHDSLIIRLKNQTNKKQQQNTPQNQIQGNENSKIQLVHCNIHLIKVILFYDVFCRKIYMYFAAVC